MLTVFKKEVSTFFNSLIGYIVIGVFLLLISSVLWVYPDSNILDYGFAEMNVFFEFCPFIFLFLIPAVTMRMFAEEYRSGTIEILFTKPISLYQIIGGKFLASLFIVFLALIPTLIYYYSIYFLGNPIGNIDSASVVGSYFGLLLLAMAFASIGIFTSSVTNNQVIAFILSAALSYFFYDGIMQLSNIFRGFLQYYINFMGLNFHYSALGKGLLDTQNIIYLTSFTIVFLVFTNMILQRKRA